ncbi:ATP-binding protein [Thermosulfidibacter takaii ABI70S6]|uniref:tRNA threonylcarbamoyladenosine biosynthesis protein TsaE n=1 Tax=Thermosulfidibacter takaii (strain DSM 17441 / JCM 13301 / NBRC 103674 / ABI70S6) TaxID=1298851 RepID=A0A0S3QTQ3_THET7|nr:tRNA (adenosine(37)-N6)-threonylcarbamoyltransferase complex ATPase subunit type 1 TsaE [Thermosulfidibacter takaii]BAT71681.1 ATP-binding protein [Thermosulfidibacter takaii ABI70S6]
MKQIISTSEEETIKIAKNIGKSLKKGYLVLLSGVLGAGKTRFAKGIAEALEVKDEVTSPTFTIVNEYRGKYPLYHIDLYRLDRFPDEDISLDEMLDEGVVVVEWWEKDRDFFVIYSPRIEVFIRPIGENGREITVRCYE